MPAVTRFAPSPTGELHLGSAYSALVAWKRAREGRRHLPAAHRGHRHPPQPARVRKLDPGRSRMAGTGLGRRGAPPVRAFRRLRQGAGWAQQARPDLSLLLHARRHRGLGRRAAGTPDGPIYPGTCRHRTVEERRRLIAEGREFCLRLDAGKAAAEAGPYHFVDEGARPHRGRAAAVRRRRAGAQGHTDQLSSGGHGRRSSAGRDPGDARRGPAALDTRPRPAAAPARLRHAALRPSPPADGPRRQAAGQARQVHLDPPIARQRQESEEVFSLLPKD